MAGEWTVRPLEGCMADLIDYRGKTPQKTSFGIPLITAKVVRGGRIETPDEFIAVDDYEPWMCRGIPQAGDVVITTELDDKIELNRRMNETLEAMARALFKSWFVDFYPVRAKSEGRGSGLPKPLADLFPDSFEDSELGEIPKGWRCSQLREVTAKIGSGATPRGGGSLYIADGVALIRSQNVYDSLFVWDGLARITDTAAVALHGVTVEHEDVLMNITGASILRTCASWILTCYQLGSTSTAASSDQSPGYLRGTFIFISCSRQPKAS